MQIDEKLITFKNKWFYSLHIIQIRKREKDHFCSRNLVFLLLKNQKIARQSIAGVAKLVDAPDLGSGAARRGGSSPSTRTTTS